MSETESRIYESVFSIDRLLRKIVLFAYGYYLLFLFKDNSIEFYIHERYQALTLVSSLILIFAALTYSSYVEKRGHEHRKKAPAVRRLICTMLPALLLAPVICGFITPPKALGFSEKRMSTRFSFSGGAAAADPEALKQRGSGDITLAFPPGAVEDYEERTYTPLNVMELNYLFSAGGGAYIGDRVAVQGFVYRDDTTQYDVFTLVRYMIPCCVVHAYPVTVKVKSPETESLETDQWVVVYGAVAEAENAAAETAGDDTGCIVSAERIELKDQPQNPYINRWNTSKPFRF